MPACPMPPRRLRSPVVPWKGSLPLPIGSHRPTKWPIPAEARRCAPQLGARRPTLDGGTTSTCSAPGSSVLTASSSHHPQIERDSNRSQLIDLFPTSTMAARHPHGGNSAAPRPGVLLAQWPAAVCACGSQRAPTTSPCSRTRSCSGAPLAPTERPTSLAQQCPSSVNGKTYSLGTLVPVNSPPVVSQRRPARARAPAAAAAPASPRRCSTAAAVLGSALLPKS